MSAIATQPKQIGLLDLRRAGTTRHPFDLDALALGDRADAQTKTEELLEAVQRFARTR